MIKTLVLQGFSDKLWRGGGIRTHVPLDFESLVMRFPVVFGVLLGAAGSGKNGGIMRI